MHFIFLKLPFRMALMAKTPLQLHSSGVNRGITQHLLSGKDIIKTLCHAQTVQNAKD
uniref:Uncharacterized protein n=1 Tax=Anguilla anguilla TaxID=7936 RepID=A0A0E9WD93_ANGAN